MTTRTMSWRTAWPPMCFHMVPVMRAEPLRSGGRERSASEGGSVASARAARLSMRRLQKSICCELSGSWRARRSCMAPASADPASPEPREQAAAKLRTSATMLTVTWNWRNLRTLLCTERPHTTAWQMEAKLSSRMITSEAPLATSVPVMPMARPTLACLRAGPSLVPSPVAATTSSSFRRVSTSRCLSSGEERARTRSERAASRSAAGSSWRAAKSRPSMTVPAGGAARSAVAAGRMPQFRAMAVAVSMWSPVTMMTRMPAPWHLATAPGTSRRSGSRIPSTATSSMPPSSSKASHSAAVAGHECTLRRATAMVRSAACTAGSNSRSTAARSSRFDEPSACSSVSQRPTTTSKAPLK
mmetsp:Transcript_25709/g.96815  ORF Transcript_25709/g.96815 Transcript_25709/m.96815 type:complete len:358 (-) Transcript_25709:153-1226(-)